MTPWLTLLPIGGIAWWLLGFPPGWGWLVLPIVPPMPVNIGEVVVFGTIVVGLYGGLAWLRNNL